MESEKEKIRKKERAERQEQNTSEIMEKSHTIMSKLMELDEFKKAENVLFYISFGSEVMTYDAINATLMDGKTVYIPYLNGKDMKFTKINDLSGLRKSHYGALEPVNMDNLTRDVLDLVIVPGMAFDRKGNRIGSGLGFYDRFMRGRNMKKIAVCFDMQIVDNVYEKEHDVPVDIIITEKEVIRC
jgi:5-formyltetrahydrofolate cyclo-ligase